MGIGNGIFPDSPISRGALNWPSPGFNEEADPTSFPNFLPPLPGPARYVGLPSPGAQNRVTQRRGGGGQLAPMLALGQALARAGRHAAGPALRPGLPALPRLPLGRAPPAPARPWAAACAGRAGQSKAFTAAAAASPAASGRSAHRHRTVRAFSAPLGARRVLTTTRPSRAAAPHLDSMPRFPEMSAGGLLRGLDYFGTAAFAMSGCVTASLAGMDVLGCTLVGTVTAVGGGTVRDLLLNAAGPVFWMVEAEYIWISVATCLGTLALWPAAKTRLGIDEDHATLFWADALGIGAFCCIGAMNGIRAGVVSTCGRRAWRGGGLTKNKAPGPGGRVRDDHLDVRGRGA